MIRRLIGDQEFKKGAKVRSLIFLEIDRYCDRHAQQFAKKRSRYIVRSII